MFCLIACLGAISGCSGETPCAFETTEKPEIFVSELYVSFVDSAGNNLAAGLKQNKTIRIDREDYSLFMHFLSYCRGYPYDNWKFAYSKNNYTLEFKAFQKEEAPQYVRYDLQCAKIFGDDKFHVIESTYSNKNEESDLSYYCSSFTLDGTEYDVDKKAALRFFSISRNKCTGAELMSGLDMFSILPARSFFLKIHKL